MRSAAFTSFSQDHLEYHKTMYNYLKAKLTLFTRNLINGGEAVINSDMIFFNFIKNFLLKNNISICTVGTQGDLMIIQNKQSLTGQSVSFKYQNKIYKFTTSIIGSFQAINLLIAAKLVNNLDINFNRIISILPMIKSVVGRLQRITNVTNQYQVFVDYAHTPDALQQTLQELKVLKKDKGDLHVIFGCGGERDKTKRSLMGKIASNIANKVIITDDNPRTEDPEEIRMQIKKTAINAEEIANRKKAIINTITRLKKNDILLIAGKGHENYQIIGKTKFIFSDIEIARCAVQRDLKLR